MLGLSIREAARRAGISEARWRQVVKGSEPSIRMVATMAHAVEVEPGDAFRAAGRDMPSQGSLARLIPPVPRPTELTADIGAEAAAEVERIRSLPFPVEVRLRMMRAVIDMYLEQAQDDIERAIG